MTDHAKHPIYDKLVNIDALQLVSPSFIGNKRVPAQRAVSDIRPYVNRIDIFENLFAPAITGRIHLYDTLSISNIAPLIGLEQLQLQFSNYNYLEKKRRTYGPHIFLCHSQKNRTPISQNAEEYVLDFITPEFLNSVSRKLSFSFFDNPETIIEKLVKEPYGLASSKSITTQKTANKIKMVVPYMQPLEVIKLITLQGLSDTEDSNYTFFETLDGYFYTSFREILRTSSQDQNIPTIYQDLAGYRETGDTVTLIKAEQLEEVSGHDLLYSVSKGYFASTTYGVDVLSGVCGVQVSGAGVGTNYDKRYKVNPTGTELYPKELSQLISPTSRIFVVPTTQFSAKNSTITSKDNSITDNYLAQTLDARNRELLGLQSKTIRGRVAGAPELHPGKVINVQFPTMLNNKTNTQIKDKTSGRYIITNTQHSIVRNGSKFLYEVIFEAVSDSFA